MFEGSNVALITPFADDGSVDEGALRQLVGWHIDAGTHGLVAVGTTGEASALSHDEHRHVLKCVVDEAAGRIPVIAGCGSNNTDEAIALHHYANEVGASAALHVTGYYNRPSQAGISQHFKALDSSNDLPIIVYNVPARTGVDIAVETLIELSSLSNVVGVKDASQNLSRPCIEAREIPAPFSFLSGEDATAVAYNASGGSGCISVTANVAPSACARMQQACLDGDYPTAIAIQSRLTPLHHALFLEPSPAGVKYACAQLQLCNDTTRLPMLPLQAEARRCITAAMGGLGLLNQETAPVCWG